MESLSDIIWDVIICGTGLQQSLLALALSRSDKKILHIDPNGYYGSTEAAFFSLQEVKDWAAGVAAATDSSKIFSAATAAFTTKEGEAGLSNPRGYALTLSPQLIHANSTLLSQLVSSRAFRQLEFLAVGSFFVFNPAASTSSITRIPSTREDVFSTTALSARAKRQLMKFLKLVLSHQDESSLPQWQEYGAKPLADFLTQKLSLDRDLITYVIALTLSLDGRISTKDGLQAIHRHLTSMGKLGPGFAAVYPKWGGGSEIAQVGCRASAVGGGTYMLGTGYKKVTKSEVVEGEVADSDRLLEIELTDDTVVKTKMFVRGPETVFPNGTGSDKDTVKMSRLVAVVDAPLTHLFEITMEGAPTPAVAVIALPPGSMKADNSKVESESTYPIYVIVHSSDTGECPTGQSILYLNTVHTLESKSLLEETITSLLVALTPEDGAGAAPRCLYQLYYEQTACTKPEVAEDEHGLVFASTPNSLTFDDEILDSVQQVWQKVMGEAVEAKDVQYMVFTDREGVGEDDDYE
ncbi:GDP dissociation inhibitor-domain-containing protein [Coniella lustricola]|uniref:Rab proteins geranylgeranyltransferase n=1 Tax=Coniella lustricola TaxID=2025994 RepID=A0A2T3A6N2_9PEZI|nr:GDP dissociation inhibitor-domain-containing protein [Coniella lustricola]